MERGRAIITVLVLGIVFGLFWWFCAEVPRRDAAFKASIVEIEAEILSIRYDEAMLRKVDTREELTIKVNMPFRTTGEEEGLGLPKISKDKVLLDRYEIGEESRYRIKYGGTSEIKKILEIELTQSKEEWIKKQAASDEIPDISNWHFISIDTDQISVAETLRRFEYSRRGDIICFAFYDSTTYTSPHDSTTKEKSVPMAMELRYRDKDYKTFARNIWIKEGNNWKLYRLEKDDKRYIRVSEENGKVKFELR